MIKYCYYCEVETDTTDCCEYSSSHEEIICAACCTEFEVKFLEAYDAWKGK